MVRHEMNSTEKVILYYCSSLKLSIIKQYNSLSLNIQSFAYGIDCSPTHDNATKVASEIPS